jgi:hypothetical protein
MIAYCMISWGVLRAQYTADKIVGKKNEHEIDSMKLVDYPYLLPIWGQKVIHKGYNLPYSAGMSMQYLWQQSEVVIDNLQIGFNNGPKYNMDQLVRFDKAQTTTNGINIRPDFWLFPFLNVYGIFSKSKTSTAINAGLWLPDSTAWHKVVDFSTKANFDATTYGFGLTPTIGISGYFLALDMNFTWTDIEELDKPAFAFIFGPRLGKNFTFKNPQRNLAVWIGGFRVSLNSGTSGSLNASELFSLEQWTNKIDSGYTKVESSQQKVDSWWEQLTPAEQKNPVNIAKYQTANAALSTAGKFLDGASQIVSGAGAATIQYSLDKRPKDKWNFVIGSQFQLNKSWMIRVEYGFLGTRQQFIGGLQYRFGL